MRLTDVLLIRKVVLANPIDPWFRRDQWMKFAFFYKGRKARCFKLGINRVYKSLQYMKDLREVRKLEAKDLWTERISIASQDCGLPDGQVLCEGLAQSNIALNRSMLQLLAIYEPCSFSALADVAKQYHVEKGTSLPNPNTQSRVFSRGLLLSPIVPGNRHLYEH